MDIAEPFAHEKLSPVLAMYRVQTFQEAVEKAQRLLEQYKKASPKSNPLDTDYLDDLDLIYEDPEDWKSVSQH